MSIYEPTPFICAANANTWSVDSSDIILVQTNKQPKKNNPVDLSPQANSTDWSTAICRRNLVPTFVDRGPSRCQHGGFPYGRWSQFSRPEPLLFFLVAPHLSSQGLSGLRSRPTATQKIWQRQESNPGPLSLQLGSLGTRPQRRSYLCKQIY
jgi:hypothetical protein